MALSLKKVCIVNATISSSVSVRIRIHFGSCNLIHKNDFKKFVLSLLTKVNDKSINWRQFTNCWHNFLEAWIQILSDRIRTKRMRIRHLRLHMYHKVQQGTHLLYRHTSGVAGSFSNSIKKTASHMSTYMVQSYMCQLLVRMFVYIKSIVL